MQHHDGFRFYRGQDPACHPQRAGGRKGMPVILYEMAHSPFCIPAAEILRASGVPFERREIPNWDRSEILRLTDGAYYQVPVLDHDGTLVFESGADTQDVARYLDRAFARGALFPPHLDGMQSIVLDFIENEVEARTFKLVDPSYIDAIPDVAARGMTIRHKERKFGRGCVAHWRRDAAALRAESDALLDRFEITLRHARFLFGDGPVYSDFLLLGIVGNLTWRGYNQLSPERQSALGRWREELAQWKFPAR
jgi:glutathione S-transferase